VNASGSSLSSVASSLDDLVRRVRATADALGPEDEVGAELVEVERQLQAAVRRLTKLTRRLDR
jgi:hypothetical protein